MASPGSEEDRRQGSSAVDMSRLFKQIVLGRSSSEDFDHDSRLSDTDLPTPDTG